MKGRLTKRLFVRGNLPALVHTLLVNCIKSYPNTVVPQDFFVTIVFFWVKKRRVFFQPKKSGATVAKHQSLDAITFGIQGSLVPLLISVALSWEHEVLVAFQVTTC